MSNIAEDIAELVLKAQAQIQQLVQRVQVLEKENEELKRLNVRKPDNKSEKELE